MPYGKYKNILYKYKYDGTIRQWTYMLKDLQGVTQHAYRNSENSIKKAAEDRIGQIYFS